MFRHVEPCTLSLMRCRIRTLTLLAGFVVLGGQVVAADQGACATLVLTIKVDPRDHRVLYAGTELDGLLRSTDGGANWAPLIGPRVESVSALLFDPTDNLSVYGATYGEYLFKSSDGGTTWEHRSRGLVPPPCGPFPCINTPEFHGLAADPGAPSMVYAAAASLYRSQDGGANWDRVSFSPSGEQWFASAILVVPPPDSAIYVAADALPNQYAIFRSADHGATWSATAQAPPTQVFSLAVDRSNPAVLYAGTTQGVFKSADRGEHWRPSNAGLPIRQPYQFPVLDLTSDSNEPGTLYASADFYRIFKSTDHGESWMSSQQGLVGERVNATAIDPTDSSVVYAATWSGVFRSSDGGANWQRTFALGATPTILGTEPAGGWSSSDGSSGSFLIVIGKGLDAGSVLSFNGSPRKTTRFSCTRLFVDLPSDDTARPGLAWLTVTNSDGARSDPFLFVIEPALPARTVNPVSAPHGTLRLVQPRR
jgi:photosystem II stability/assembly factor-like uncharacterized protein